MLLKKETTPLQPAGGPAATAKFDVAVPHLWLPIAFRVENDSVGARLVRVITPSKEKQGSDSATVSSE